jgi:hypothetical protein
MKRILLILAFLTWAHTSFATSAHVQTVKVDTSGSSVAFPAITVTAGNLLTVFFRGGNSADTLGISDSLMNTWTAFPAQYADASADAIAGWYAKNISGGSDTITVTSASAPSMRGQASEWSGLDTSSPADQKSTPNEATVVNFTTNSITTTQATEMLIMFAESQTNQTPVDSTLGTGNGTIPTNGTSTKTAIQYHHETATGTYTGTLSTYTGTDPINGFIVSFRDSGGGGGGGDTSHTGMLIGILK